MHNRFSFTTLDEFTGYIREHKIDIPISKSTDILFTPVSVGPFTAPNALAVQPMEGCDGTPDGSPGPLTVRRYQRIAEGGAGIIWFEACAVMHEGRANPRQLWIHTQNVNTFRTLTKMCRSIIAEKYGRDFRPVFILQLTHSGRYSRPDGNPAPIIAHHSEILDPRHNLPPEFPLVTDNYLDELQERFSDAAALARDAGFDGVDIKSCHRYIISELLASHTRENSRYGGTYENRTRMIRETVTKLRARFPEMLICTRINAFDGIPYPYGWGTDKNDFSCPDLTEPLKLFDELNQLGIRILNITIGNPYSNPHIGRPYDRPVTGAPIPDESPLYGVSRFVHIVRDVQLRFPDLLVVGGGYSWLRQLFPYVASGILEKKWASIIGLGRLAFAYPDFACDLMEHGRIFPEKTCIACSKCTQIMRDDGQTGCVVRDAQTYASIYRECRKKATQH